MKSLLFLAAFLPSCGTILNGGPFMVPVRSSPPGAWVRYEGSVVGQTPCSVPMYGRDNVLSLAADRGETIVEVPTDLNWIGALGNGCLLLPGLLIGLPIDFSTGCHRVIVTDEVYVTLR